MISPTPIKLRDPNGYTHYATTDAEGYFFIYQPRGGVLNTYHCREELETTWDDYPKCRWLGFMWTAKIMVARTERVWTELETKMGVAPADQTVFHRVLDPNGEDGDLDRKQVLLHLSPFWVKTQTHRSVCSLLLRLLVVHYVDSWDKAVKAYDLANGCRDALEWFLAGNTRPLFKHWEDEHDRAMEAYDKAMIKWEKACAAIDRAAKDIPYPEEPEEPLNRVDEYGYGFYGAYTDRPMDETRRLLVKP